MSGNRIIAGPAFFVVSGKGSTGESMSFFRGRGDTVLIVVETEFFDLPCNNFVNCLEEFAGFEATDRAET